MDAWLETLNWSAILLLRLLKHTLLMLTEKGEGNDENDNSNAAVRAMPS
jgi:hypothetical protein